ncbi:T6SS phospholipase effector Tle1-like catalytic domain-containing protein [Chitinimonas taiwanensis]|uniref:Uncharacterized alpha/beta hydrolase domain n=1 Tax=Chitinimonas taiwanensis DSM 18899 TaxID=1121279 RepID=A0A1K2HS32_9NEIS|nr:DUF2235 domain-containing protein [Chitinimonas taiwanensis]SFZ79563.1 Uncharacterized alpha/beta hydrolase domain [Chitinimonas taiwanensis DSM 18899]
MSNTITPKIKSVENMVKRARAKTNDKSLPACPTCHVKLWISFFFDGTGNHRRRDFPNKHSNVAALFDAHLEEQQSGIIRHYYEGLGTPFEFSERYEKRLVVSGRHIHEVEDVGYKEEGESGLGLAFADGITERLEKATFEFMRDIDDWKEQRRVDEINLAAFGFSRGATEARAFIHWIAGCSKVTRDGARLRYNGIPLNIKFLGLFDTVESVGMAADNKLPELIKTTIPSYVEKCSHIVAAHELRHAFPLTVGDGKARHIVYPGAHADIGGGYDAVQQGRPNTLARIALLQMLDEARGAGLKMMSLGELQASDDWKKLYSPSFNVPDTALRTLNNYMAVTKPSGTIPSHFEAHTKQYWAWIDSGMAKADVEAKIKTSTNAEDLKALRRMAFLLSILARTPRGKGAKIEPPDRKMISPAVGDMFSTYVHDSFEHFSVSGGTLQTDMTNANYYTIRPVLSPTA